MRNFVIGELGDEMFGLFEEMRYLDFFNFLIGELGDEIFGLFEEMRYLDFSQLCNRRARR